MNLIPNIFTSSPSRLSAIEWEHTPLDLFREILLDNLDSIIKNSTSNASTT